MTNYHPTDNELIEYSSGNIDWALSICISTHLHYCSKCKKRIAELNQLGGHCLSTAKKTSLASTSFNDTMEKIRAAEKQKVSTSVDIEQAPKAPAPVAQLPKILQKIINKPEELQWSKVSPSLKAARLTTEQEKYEVCLHKIKKGGKVIEHDHKGLEVTVVLEGSFSDENGTYNPGDYIVKQPGEKHRPTAALNRDCLCLSIVEAPVKVTGILGAVINPFLKIHPQ